MNQSARTAFSLLSLSAVCLISIFGILYNFFIAAAVPEADLSAEIISDYASSNLIDSALKAEIIVPAVNLASEINSPFKPFHYQPVRLASKPVVKAAVTHNRLPLKLRGLMKNPPLVIVEDEKGETHIKARGDNIRSALVVSIGSSSAVFKDSSGTYELTVEESR